MRFLEARSSGVKASPAKRIVSMLKESMTAGEEGIHHERQTPSRTTSGSKAPGAITVTTSVVAIDKMRWDGLPLFQRGSRTIW